MPKVIYLTGAPASGKSSAAKALITQKPEIAVWTYGERLAATVQARGGLEGGHSELRAKSAAIVTPEDVEDTDRALLAFVQEHRASQHVLIDSHPVTKEDYGFRVTPFSLAQFASLSPSEIWVLYATPQETLRRIAADPDGRPTITEEEARMHTFVQSSVATTYGASIRCPTYLFDASGSREDLVAKMMGRLG